MTCDNSNGNTVKTLSFAFSAAFLIAVPFAILHTGEVHVLKDWFTILKSPSPLVTDYFLLGSLPATFLNAGLCGLFCALFMLLAKIECNQSHLSGFFLVIAHCFYGLNLLSMLFPVFGIFIFCLTTKKKFSDTFSIAMLSTAFGPFFSEILWRSGLYSGFPAAISVAIVLAISLGFTIPPLLEAAKQLHKGFNLYNAGLAFGLLGLVIYSFMFRTLGNPDPVPVQSGKISYALFSNTFFACVFTLCLVSGFVLNGKSFKGYGRLLTYNGKQTDFLNEYGRSLTLINIGFYGLAAVLYSDCVIFLTDGAGWSGATCGIVLAAIAFSASGQTPKNVWPVVLGYIVLSFVVNAIGLVTGRPAFWSLSTQEYINGLAFATGLCPITGTYGVFAGIIAGFTDAVICTTAKQLHGGLMLYNGGLTAGLTAIIVTPVIAYYRKKKK